MCKWLYGRGMSKLLTPDEIERLARSRGETMKEVCAAAGVAFSTFWRWKNDRTSPSIEVYQRLVDAVSTITESVQQET